MTVEGRTVLVLGAYGLIGAAVSKALAARGWRVIGLGRSRRAGLALFPAERWITADLARLTRPEDWAAHLAGVDAVVNAAGALQDGPRDDLEAVHATAIRALVAACEARDMTRGMARLAQISAPGASAEASTAFLRGKARGDAAVRASRLHWCILRPGLVIGDVAYGGSALLRMLASAPLILPLTLPGARLRTVSLEDVAVAVARALEPEFPPGVDAALVEERERSLEEVALAFRRWLGVGAPRLVLRLPIALGAAMARLGDLLVRLGWRTALNSTSMAALRDGVIADPEPWRRLSGAPLASLEKILAAPADSSRRREARLALLKPLMLASLALLWLGSGAASLLNFRVGMDLLAPSGLAPVAARALILGGAALDVLIGFAVLFRRGAAPACQAMLAVTAAYLLAASILTPWLWLDPLAPLLKALPAAMLALVALTLLEER